MPPVNDACDGQRFDELSAFVAADVVVNGERQVWTATSPGSGRPVTTQESAMYRIEDGLIAEVWVAADNAALLESA